MSKYLLTLFVAGIVALGLAFMALLSSASSGPAAFANATCEEDWDDIGDDEDQPGEVDDADCGPDGLPIRDDDDDDSDDGPSDDLPLSGSTYDRAVQAALAHTGGGTVTDFESGDDGAAYGVEIRLSNGREVEVNLDANFNVIRVEDD